MFIKLTIEGNPIWINTAHIVVFGRLDKAVINPEEHGGNVHGAWVTINKGDDSYDMWVDESIEQIESVIKDVTYR